MKVRCIRLQDWRGGSVERSPWLTVGKVYQVLELVINHGKMVVRLVGDEPTPALFDINQFEIATGKLPENWTLNRVTPDFVVLGPSPWARADFWKDYFDRELGAVACFQEESERILASDP